MMIDMQWDGLVFQSREHLGILQTSEWGYAALEQYGTALFRR